MATIEFHGRYLEKGRGNDGPAFEAFASLIGQVLRDKDGVQATLSVAPDAEPSHVHPPAEGERRELRLLANGSPGVEQVLRLPPDPSGRGRYFELTTELRIGGDIEAPVGTSDVFDVALEDLAAGLLLEWPQELDAKMPEGLTLIATQADVVRPIRWRSARVLHGRRRFLFRGIQGSAPVNLEASFAGQRVVLWQAQDVSDEAKAPVWTSTLELAVARHVPERPAIESKHPMKEGGPPEEPPLPPRNTKAIGSF